MGLLQRTKPWRLGGLLLLLAGVAMWAWVRERRLDLRTRWIKAVEVSVVLVASAPVGAETEDTWRRALPQLEDWFSAEWSRYRPPADVPMVTFTLDGVVQLDALPALPGSSQGANRTLEGLAFQQALRRVEARLAPRPPRDLTVFVLLRPAVGVGQVEGVAEAGGRRGVVDGTLGSVDLTLELVALAHEVLHCLGATDKYDEAGHARGPQALVAPEQEPLYPQQEAEVMVGERPLGPGEGAPVKALGEVGVGPKTAEEIRWR